MIEFIQHTINGLALGSIYALVALGYTMVFGVLQLINFAHGDFFMIGAFAGFYFIRAAGAASHITALETSLLRVDYDSPLYKSLCLGYFYDPFKLDICRCVLYSKRIGGIITYSYKCPDGVEHQLQTVP